MGDRGLARESDLKTNSNRGRLERGRPWGKLVKVDSPETQVLLVKGECTVGRGKTCDLSFPANHLVSGNHCKIIQDQWGKVWLEDMSTHGTVINRSTLVRKQTHLLQNGDVLYFVYRKNTPELDLAYVYHSIQAEHAESQDIDSVGPSSSGATEEKSSVLPPEGSAVLPRLSQPCISSVLNTNSSAKKRAPAREKCTREPEVKKRKTKHDDCDLSLPNPSRARTEAAGGSPTGSQDPPPVGGTNTNKTEDLLTCIICQDLLYDCVSLQPCMHTFCAACYSGWMERSDQCPSCRCRVERINRNHMLNNLVEDYLTQHPEKRRSEEDKKSMDGRNKITRDMLQPKVEPQPSDEDSSDFDELFGELIGELFDELELPDIDDDSWVDNSSDSSSSFDSSDSPSSLSELSDSDGNASNTGDPFEKKCRQCVGYRKEGSSRPTPAKQAAPRLAGAAQPSTSSVIGPQGYRCPAQGGHIMCTCCKKPMPDRHGERSSSSSQQEEVPAQQCMLCHQPYCHMYWGCQKFGCRGCLVHFSKLNLTDKFLGSGVLNSNKHESGILRNYLSSRGMSWKEMFQEALQGLQQGSFYLSDSRVNADVVVCNPCGLQSFKELAYRYRQNIPLSALPAAVTSRPDCYWGRNCRMQVRKDHAERYNHICEQTRSRRR